MKTGIFGTFGGWPLTQNRLKDMQEGNMEAFAGVLSMLGDGSTPVILSGMAENVVPSGPSWLHVLTEGYFYYCVPGGVPQVYHCPMDSAVTSNGAYVTYVDVTDVTTDAYYNSGTAYPVINDSYGTVSADASGAGTDTHLEFSDFIDFAEAMRRNVAETGWNDLALANVSGAITGHLYYKKNRLTNQLEYKLQIAVATPSAFGDAPGGSLKTLGTLPVEYRPASDVFIMARLEGNAGTYVLLNVGGYVTSIAISIDSASGLVSAIFAKPDASFSSLGVYGNGVFSLD